MSVNTPTTNPAAPGHPAAGTPATSERTGTQPAPPRKSRGGLLPSDRYSIAITLAVILAATTLTPLVTDRVYLSLSVLLVLALGAISLMMRRFKVSDGLILGTQILVLVAYLLALSMGSGAGGNPFTRFVGLYGQAIDHMQSQAAPMAANAGVNLMFVTAVGMIMILTDVMVQGVDRPLWAIAPLATLFLVPALGLRQDVGILQFLAVGVGYLAILLAEGINNSTGWTRGAKLDSTRNSTGLAWRIGALVAVPAIIFTLLGSLLIPTLNSNGWGVQKPRGTDGPLQMNNPALDLRKNLNQPEDRVVMTYQTNKPDGAYLRMASLPVFDANGWQNAPMQLNSGEDLPPAAGFTQDPGELRRTDLKISDFDSEYLPLPYATDRFNADGEWAYDRDSLVVLATGQNRTKAINNLQYSVDSTDVTPDGPGLSQAKTGNPPDAQLTAPLPQDVPNDIVDLSLRLTQGVEQPALKAAAIQSYLRSDEFTYSTEPSNRAGYPALQEFLFGDKKGYCEQFAGAMAVMARVAGIPSRVAVGFLPGEKNGDNYEVSIRDMHAWPELYFEGYGWVRFEPTPSVATAPSWTVQSGSNDTDGGEPTPQPAPTEEVSPTPEPPTPSAEPTEQPAPPAAGPRIPWGKIGIGTGIGVLVLAAAAAPMLTRMGRRRRRLEAVGSEASRVENAWAEVRDSVRDTGGQWPNGSPREISAALSRRLDPQSAQAFSALALMVERARYARSLSLHADPTAVTHQIRRGLMARLDGVGRIVAVAWPQSVWFNLTEKIMTGRRKRATSLVDRH